MWSVDNPEVTGATASVLNVSIGPEGTSRHLEGVDLLLTFRAFVV